MGPVVEEGCLVVDDRAFAEEFEERWQEDTARSLQMTGQQPHPRLQVGERDGGATAAESTPV